MGAASENGDAFSVPVFFARILLAADYFVLKSFSVSSLASAAAASDASCFTASPKRASWRLIESSE